MKNEKCLNMNMNMMNSRAVRTTSTSTRSRGKGTTSRVYIYWYMVSGFVLRVLMVVFGCLLDELHDSFHNVADSFHNVAEHGHGTTTSDQQHNSTTTTTTTSTLIKSIMLPSWTDKDYRVFRYAGEKGMWNIYDRDDYKYPPVMALLVRLGSMLGVGDMGGKMLFCLCDAGCVWYYYFLSNHRLEGARWHAWYNVPAMVICSRGSADAVSNLIVLKVLDALVRGEVTWGGLWYGVAVWMRLYPVIYLPLFMVFLGSCKFFAHVKMRRFVIASGAMALFLTVLSTLYYGMPYIESAFLFHLTRQDVRHNFSAFFYQAYLCQAAAPDWRFVCDSLAVLPLVSQVVAIAAVAYHYHHHCSGDDANGAIDAIDDDDENDNSSSGGSDSEQQRQNKESLTKHMLLTTMCFVHLNKVSTAQYFTWYLVFVPLLLEVPRARTVLVKPVLLYLATMSLWLGVAYLLEFQGMSHLFLPLHAASLLFQGAALYCVMRLFTCLS